MTQSDSVHFRVENITPILNVMDMQRSLAFYNGILGFQIAIWGNENFTSVSRDNKGFFLCKNGQGSAGTWVWIGFDGDLFALHQQLVLKGVKIKLPPTNFSWAYEMQVEDPDGHILRFGTDPKPQEPFMDK